jgi:hypothetical protein
MRTLILRLEDINEAKQEVHYVEKRITEVEYKHYAWSTVAEAFWANLNELEQQLDKVLRD